MKARLISGIQPTGALHIGNYLGALKNFVALQNAGAHECLFFLADYHSLTEYNWRTAAEKRAQILDLAASFIAAGLDPKKAILFQQSAVPAHTELGWIFNTLIPVGELNRMTQFKDKGEGAASANTGLLTYPVLMAADILLYDATHVPVGSDQDQHLELARTAARKFNARFGDLFTEPKPVYTPIPRLMSLDDPEKKMSKSRPIGCVFLDDEPDEIKKKIARAVTDSGRDIAYDPRKKPAISNLLGIYAGIADTTTAEAAQTFSGASYAEFKIALAELLIAHFAPFRETKQRLLNNPSALIKIIRQGDKKADAIASAKLEKVKRAVGILL
ncbi:MAG: tryptophan--tRNA ligase [Candidatus Liptonbacteria bacterium]|nr:tryptophan--tRNA ligase [Candidatus Liptonbacteria bacterium]